MGLLGLIKIVEREKCAREQFVIRLQKEIGIYDGYPLDNLAFAEEHILSAIHIQLTAQKEYMTLAPLIRFEQLQDALCEIDKEFGVHSGWTSMIIHIASMIQQLITLREKNSLSLKEFYDWIGNQEAAWVDGSLLTGDKPATINDGLRGFRAALIEKDI